MMQRKRVRKLDSGKRQGLCTGPMGDQNRSRQGYFRAEAEEKKPRNADRHAKQLGQEKNE